MNSLVKHRHQISEHVSFSFRAFSTNRLAGKRILVTGAKGQIGKALVKSLIKENGAENVVAADINQEKYDFGCKEEFLDATNYKQYEEIVVRNKINYIYHSSALLSAAAERNVDKAMNVNIYAAVHALNIAREHKCGIFQPSTILVFAGDKTPKENIPPDTILTPSTIYGVAKVFNENLGTYYFNKFGVDFRALRYPVIVSSEKYAFDGTAVYSTQIFFEALEKKFFKCSLKPDITLPMMGINDTIEETIKFMGADNKKLTRRVYNIGGISLAPQDFENAIKKMIPEFKCDYSDIDPVRQKIAESGPRSVEDSDAKRDWGYSHNHTAQSFCEMIMKNISQDHKKGIQIKYSK